MHADGEVKPHGEGGICYNAGTEACDVCSWDAALAKVTPPTGDHADPPVPPPADPWSLALGMLVVGVSILRVVQARFDYSIWSDRDLWRSARFWQDLPTSGAELSYGGGARVPGGAYHLLQWVPLSWSGDPVHVQRAFLALDAAAMAVLAWVLSRVVGARVAILAFAVALAPSGARHAMDWIWNPSVISMFSALGLALVVRAVHTGQARTLGWAALVFALGAQSHMSVVGWMVWILAGLALSRGRWVLRGLPAMGLGLVVAYLPYVVSEVRSGFANTRALSDQRVLVPAGESGMVFEPEELWANTAFLLPDLDPLVGQSVTHPLAWGTLVLVVLGTIASWLWPRARTEAVVGRAVQLALVATVAASALDRSLKPEFRYVLVAVPAVGILAALGAHAASAWVRHPRRGAVLWTLVVMLVGLPFARELRTRLTVTLAPSSYERWVDLMAVVEARWGWSPEDLTARWVHFMPGDDGFKRVPAHPLAFFDGGQAERGSSAPPCLMTWQSDLGGRVLSAADLALELGVPAGEVRVVEQVPLRDGVAVLYDLDAWHCPTRGGNRYVLLPTEAALRAAAPDIAEGAGQPMVAPTSGVTRWGLRLPRPYLGQPDVVSGEVLAAIDLAVGTGQVSATLHSHQLRGLAYNGGWFEDALVGRPRLALEAQDGAAVHELVFDPGMVGVSGVITPLSGALAVPAGTYDVVFHTAVYALPEAHASWPLGDLPSEPVQVGLGSVRVP